MGGWRTLSLQARQLLAASLALVAFLSFTGIALDRAFVDTAQNALRARLENLANGYLSGSELDRSRAFISPEFPPDQRFMIPRAKVIKTVVEKDRCQREEHLTVDVILHMLGSLIVASYRSASEKATPVGMFGFGERKVLAERVDRRQPIM